LGKNVIIQNAVRVICIKIFCVVKCDLLFETCRKVFELNGNEILDNFVNYITRTFVIYAGHLVLREGNLGGYDA
jgi:hypothetical protein